jgi:predicted GH43/DUF377 family glycosyl hydrolase
MTDRALASTKKAAKAISVTHVSAHLEPDLRRIALRLFLPGEDTHEAHSRVGATARRILELSESDVEAAVKRVLTAFSGGVDHLTRALHEHADSIAVGASSDTVLTSARKTLLGAAFTAEYAVEAAALCNPSAVPHPDQSGLKPGQLRVAVALRGIGEGHISSIEFVSAVIGPGSTWEFGDRTTPLVQGRVTSHQWVREHYEVAVRAELKGRGNELVNALMRNLPEQFSVTEFEESVHALPAILLKRHDAVRHLEHMRALVDNAYGAAFPADSELSARVLMPQTSDEVNGMEDARFVLCTRPNGTRQYRATYTAYDGAAIAPRLIISPDLETFDVHQLSGPAATNKGMALFPRMVGGELLALTRSDGETLGISRSVHGRVWDTPVAIHRPHQLWEIIQTGNCGSPLETERGWLVLTHGVGPMREYCIGAMLLDLEDPTRVVASLEPPLLTPDRRRVGYVPNVVYSCGGIIHDGRLWIPYGEGDQRVRVCHVEVDQLLDAMVPNGK